MGPIDGGLVLRVNVLAEPCLWDWEIRDGADGRLLESSWTHERVAFASRTEAAAAGTRRLAELAAAGSVTRVDASSRRAARRISRRTG